MSGALVLRTPRVLVRSAGAVGGRHPRIDVPDDGRHEQAYADHDEPARKGEPEPQGRGGLAGSLAARGEHHRHGDERRLDPIVRSQRAVSRDRVSTACGTGQPGRPVKDDTVAR